MLYELYHDESLVGGYWHGMLLVPQSRKAWMLELLERARSNSRYSYPLGVKKVKSRNRIYDCAKAWLTVGVASLRSQYKGDPVPIYLGWKHPDQADFELLRERVGAKFILFCERDSLQKMTGHKDHASKVETIFRMGLKGGLHFLGEEQDPIRIEKIHFDGHEHHRRHIDRDRVVGRIQGLREYCQISTLPDLIDDRSSDHRKFDAQPYEDCQFIQLTDLLVGAFRSLLSDNSKQLHVALAYPVESMLLRYRQGYARMQNSRWRNSFCMSQCYLENDRWSFQRLEYERVGIPEQLELPFYRNTD